MEISSISELSASDKRASASDNKHVVDVTEKWLLEELGRIEITHEGKIRLYQLLGEPAKAEAEGDDSGQPAAKIIGGH